MKKFDTVEELKRDSDLQNMSRNGWTKVLLKGKQVYACTTDQQYEDILWGETYEMLKKFNKHFQIPEGPDTDLCSDVRDFILEKLKEQGIELVDVYDEY